MYGIDWNSPLPEPEVDQVEVVYTVAVNPLQDADFIQLQNTIGYAPGQWSIYMRTLEFVFHSLVLYLNNLFTCLQLRINGHSYKNKF